jgi:ankyrin repeat protein
LGHVEIMNEILQRSPKAATVKDVDNRSPLHYAAVARHQSASDVYRKLVEAGADEKQLDKVC